MQKIFGLITGGALLLAAGLGIGYTIAPDEVTAEEAFAIVQEAVEEAQAQTVNAGSVVDAAINR